MLKIIQDIVVKSQILLLSMYAYTTCEIDSVLMQLYNHHPAITFVTDYVLYCLLYIHSIMNQYYIEPFDNKWTYTAYLSHTNGYYALNEQYYFYNKYHLNSNLFMQSLAVESIEHIKEKNNYIMMINYENNTNIKNNINIDLSKDAKILKSPFLSICYLEPKTENKIDIKLPKKYFIENNEILSPCFIYRYLKYQPLNFEFSMNYKIEIIDIDCNVFTLKPTEYIKIKNNGYEKLRLKN